MSFSSKKASQSVEIQHKRTPSSPLHSLPAFVLLLLVPQDVPSSSFSSLWIDDVLFPIVVKLSSIFLML